MTVDGSDTKKVTFDIPVLIRFEDGKDTIVRIYKDRTGLKKGPGILISKDTPLAQAILNKQEGRSVEYTVNDKLNKVVILAVY